MNFKFDLNMRQLPGMKEHHCNLNINGKEKLKEGSLWSLQAENKIYANYTQCPVI